ncbi:MAG: gliding motility protein GldC [Vicingaceae bacterium]|nr:MAG: gliding motility protein GldC [Vicingaceae bacterium]
MNKKTNKLTIEVELDEKAMPEKIKWLNNQNELQEIKSILMALWDPSTNNTLQLDLWTKDMTTDEMRYFIVQRMFLLAETLRKSTGDEKESMIIHDTAMFLAQKFGFLKNKDQ